MTSIVKNTQSGLMMEHVVCSAKVDASDEKWKEFKARRKPKSCYQCKCSLAGDCDHSKCTREPKCCASKECNSPCLPVGAHVVKAHGNATRVYIVYTCSSCNVAARSNVCDGYRRAGDKHVFPLRKGARMYYTGEHLGTEDQDQEDSELTQNGGDSGSEDDEERQPHFADKSKDEDDLKVTTEIK